MNICCVWMLWHVGHLFHPRDICVRLFSKSTPGLPGPRSMLLNFEEYESTFTVYFSPGSRWCCGSCHLRCPPVPLMLPLAVTHRHHVSHPWCPSTMHTQTSYSFHPKDEAGSHHVSSLECRRANGEKEKGGASKVLTRHPSEFRELKTDTQKNSSCPLLPEVSTETL